MEKQNLLNGNEINLDDVLEIARKAVEAQRVVEVTETDKMEHFTQIVQGVSRKYASVYVDREDLEQELWVTTLELIKKKGGIEHTDARLVAKNCYNRAVDFYRYSRRRVDTKARLIEESESDDMDYSNCPSSASMMVSKSRTGYENVVLKEIIDLFPEGSKERKYVVTKLYMFGEIDPDHFESNVDMLELPENESEESVLKLLGFNSRYPASWGKMKYSIREKIYRYMGILPEEGQAIDESKQLHYIKERVETIFSESSSGYIDVRKLAKDKPMKLLGGSEELIWEAMSSSKKLLRGISIDGKQFIMKDEPRYLKNSAKTGDTILPKE